MKLIRFFNAAKNPDRDWPSSSELTHLCTAVVRGNGNTYLLEVNNKGETRIIRYLRFLRLEVLYNIWNLKRHGSPAKGIIIDVGVTPLFKLSFHASLFEV